MQQKTITTTLLFIFHFNGQIAQRVRVYYTTTTTTHTQIRESVYIVWYVIASLASDSLFRCLTNNKRPKQKKNKKKKKRLVLLTFQGSLSFFYTFLKPWPAALLMCRHAHTPVCIEQQQKTRGCVYILHSVFNLRPRGCCVFE